MPRQSKYNKEEKDNVKSYQYKAAIYIRLSVEDGDKEESNSITNQRMLLNQFLKDNSDIEVYDYYTDDGFSGTDFERPGFQKLLNDIKNKKINWKLFPPNFLKYPIHLQHCHKTGWTEGAVHAYCNAVMWQYEGR